MSTTATQTHRTAMWRTDARLRTRAVSRTSVLGAIADGNHGIAPSTDKVTFPAIAPTRRGALAAVAT